MKSLKYGEEQDDISWFLCVLKQTHIRMLTSLSTNPNPDPNPNPNPDPNPNPNLLVSQEACAPSI